MREKSEFEGVVDAFKAEQDALISSFSQALSDVGRDEKITKGQLIASMGVALTTLSASASNALLEVGREPSSGFAERAKAFRQRLAARLKG